MTVLANKVSALFEGFSQISYDEIALLDGELDLDPVSFLTGAEAAELYKMSHDDAQSSITKFKTTVPVYDKENLQGTPPRDTLLTSSSTADNVSDRTNSTKKTKVRTQELPLGHIPTANDLAVPLRLGEIFNTYERFPQKNSSFQQDVRLTGTMHSQLQTEHFLRKKSKSLELLPIPSPTTHLESSFIDIDQNTQHFDFNVQHDDIFGVGLASHTPTHTISPNSAPVVPSYTSFGYDDNSHIDTMPFTLRNTPLPGSGIYHYPTSDLNTSNYFSRNSEVLQKDQTYESTTNTTMGLNHGSATSSLRARNVHSYSEQMHNNRVNPFITNYAYRPYDQQYNQPELKRQRSMPQIELSSLEYRDSGPKDHFERTATGSTGSNNSVPNKGTKQNIRRDKVRGQTSAHMTKSNSPKQRRVKWSDSDIYTLWKCIAEKGNEWREVQKNLPKRTYHQVKDKGRRVLQQEMWETGKTKKDSDFACEVAKDIGRSVVSRLKQSFTLDFEALDDKIMNGFNSTKEAQNVEDLKDKIIEIQEVAAKVESGQIEEEKERVAYGDVNSKEDEDHSEHLGLEQYDDMHFELEDDFGVAHNFMDFT